MYSISVKYLQDSKRESRLYNSFQISAVREIGEVSTVNISGSTYSPNSSSLLHITRFKAFDSFDEAQKAFDNKTEEKLRRDRKFLGGVTETFSTKGELKNFLTINLKMTISDAKKLLATIGTIEARRDKEKEMTFEEVAESRLKSIDDIAEMEKLTDLGKETAKMNTNWGMF